MKHYNKLLLGAVALGMLTACADESLLQPGAIQMPEEMAQLAYLNDYGVLKSYVDRGNNPDFKLGIALAVDDYLKQSMVYGLAVSNFDEMTAGNAMKYASIVANDGTMDFSKVTDFVQTAKEAGMTVYGHTLCWHSQQNKTYLESLIAPTVIPGEATDGGYCLKLKNSAASANVWDAQTWYQLSTPLQAGQTYTLKFMAKASEAYSPEIYLQCSDGGNQEYPGGFSVGTAWQECTVSLTPSGSSVDKIAFNFGTFAGEIYIDDVSLTVSGSDANLIPNGDFEDETITGWTGWTPGAYETISEDGEGYVSGSAVSGGAGYSLVLKNSAVSANIWDAQTWYQLSTPLQAGQTYTLNFMVKASAAYSPEIYLQCSDGGNQEYPGGFSAETTWQERTVSLTPSGSSVDKIAFNFGTFAGEIYIDNVSLVASGSETNLIPNGDFEDGTITGWTGWTPGAFESISEEGEGYSENAGGGQIIEKTPEEKEAILTDALERWIEGMMKACKENPTAAEGEDAGATLVKAWDAVNEPMDDSGSPSLKYSWTQGDTENFYWQDYLGENYVRKVVEFARKYGGEDLKLFINDYNLEAAYNNNAKCKALIDWIAKWESDGVTRIDGIGTQMHVSYSLNAETQKKNEECVVQMFEMLAASGKLVKISELDMGILDENGEEMETEKVTFEQQELMADYYRFIISKYFEIIPAAQRYGITQWSATDSPAGSGWRAGMPIGLWDLNYNRKPTYAGFADGLAGKTSSRSQVTE